jgi:2-isopropylmalate synthase
VLVSDQSGVSNINFKAQVFGEDFARNPDAARRLLAELKELEYQGYSFEDADASFFLRAAGALGKRQSFFEPVDYRLWVGSDRNTEAVVRVRVNESEEHTVCAGDGPVHALDQALRKALRPHFPAIERFHLIDYKVRLLDGEHATAAKTRVHIETTDGERSWNTVGVAENIIAASWQAILESIEYGLQINLPPA